MRKQTKRRTGTFTKQHLCFLDAISKQVKFSGGKNLSRTSILRVLLDVTRKLDVDVSHVRSEEDLKSRIIAAFKDSKKLAK